MTGHRPEPLGVDHLHVGQTGKVSARPVEAGNETDLDGIGRNCEHNRDGCGYRLAASAAAGLLAWNGCSMEDQTTSSMS